MRIERYGKTRYWAVYDDATLVCVCLYKEGCPRSPTALVEPLEDTPRSRGRSEGLFCA